MQSSRDIEVQHAQPSEKMSFKSVLIPVFVLSLFLPIIFAIGPLRLSPYRLLLMLLFLPALFSWLSGASGKKGWEEFLFLFYSIWATIALVKHLGIANAVEPSGILVVETFGTYLVARWLVTDGAKFRLFCKIMFLSLVFLLPFSLHETVTGTNLLNKIFDAAFRTFPDVYKPTRWGLDRVQGPFEHPITFGVICSSCFALCYYVLGCGLSLAKRLIYVLPSVAGTFFALSSGPLSALVAQVSIIAWDKLLAGVQRRWVLLFFLILVAYIGIDLLSNRDPIRVFISYFAFSASTAYNRILIWEYGSAEALRHPIFGIGFNEWTRPDWMSGSMDMFWLVHAVRFGLPAAILFVLAVFVMVYKLCRLKGTNMRMLEYRSGLVVSIAGLSLAGWTVHYWNATYCLFVFMVGCGAWLLREESEAVETKREVATAHNSDKREESKRAKWTRPRRNGDGRLGSVRSNPNSRLS